MRKKIIFILIFSVAFAFVEASVVYYLRIIFGIDSNFVPSTNYREVINLGFIAFLAPKSLVLPDQLITHVESLRELSTIVMLVSISLLAGKNLKTRIAAFLISFATWDLFYYVFLYALAGWPTSLFDIDVYFLDPVVWVGPVITPLVIDSILLVTGIWMFLGKEKKK